MKKAKRIVPVLLPLLLFGSCGDTAYQDGSYHAEAAGYDDSGWKEYLDITVSGGKITDVDYDALHREDGRRKSEDIDYQAAYRAAGLGTDPADYTVRLEDALLERQKVQQIDGIAGATVSTGHFISLAEKLQEQMETGDTKSCTVPLE
jgi:major membrane immunogen (membrane-anchored lipoprotein)